MGKFLNPLDDLFGRDEIVHRVPIVSDVNRNNIIGTAYVAEDEIILHIQSDTLKREVGPMLHLDLIRQFMVGLEYKITEADRLARGKERTMGEGRPPNPDDLPLPLPSPIPPKPPKKD